MKREVINSLRLEIDSRSKNEALARQLVSAFIIPEDPTVEELADLRTVVSEAVTNSVIHGYGGGKGKIIISLKLYEDRTLILKVRDLGNGIEDVEKAMQPMFTTDPSGERGGMGFPIMRSFTDSIKVKSKPGAGTTVTMVKKLSSEDGK